MPTPNAGALWLLLTLKMLQPHGAAPADHRPSAAPPAQAAPAAARPLVAADRKATSARPKRGEERLAKLDPPPE